MTTELLTTDELQTFEADGYLLVPGLLNEEEVYLLGRIARADQKLVAHASSRDDGEGGTTRLALRNDLYDDTYSAIVRSRRVVDRMELLLGGEVYHYHHKMTLKEPRIGGAWAWHQDYGYWYNNGCLFPYMASCMVAVDPATRENGCLQVLCGSHHMGRVEHGPVGGQTGADPERVDAALQVLERVYCELAPGDGLFFHSNTLHRSDQNKSEHPRWAFIACYNAARNDPYKDGPHPRYSPLEKLDDAAVLEMARREWAERAKDTQ